MSRYVFPGLTKSQIAVFEQIACNNDRGHHPKTLRSLLERGLIVMMSPCLADDPMAIGSDVTYAVPIHHHIAWCEWCAANVGADE